MFLQIKTKKYAVQEEGAESHRHTPRIFAVIQENVEKKVFVVGSYKTNHFTDPALLYILSSLLPLGSLDYVAITCFRQCHIDYQSEF